MGVAIELDGVGKRYDKLAERSMLLKSLLPFGHARREELWALRGLDLRLEQGETLGVLGHNGAGKTTLLRLLAGVTRPTEGRLQVVGRIAPLISLGVGFHPEMSGRENVLVNGMLLGLSARQVAARFDEIVAFSELEDFIDTPVKFYSSGMSLRLGFAVIAQVEPRILLVDEVLAVGDAAFQFKCFERLRDLQDAGATIVMVSHSVQMIRQLCRRGLLIRRGRLVHDGPIEDTIALHTAATEESIGHSAAVEILSARLLSGAGDGEPVPYDAPVELALRIRFHEPVDDPVVAIGIRTAAGLFGGFDATPAGQRWRSFSAAQDADVRIAFPARFADGAYELLVDIKERDGTTLARLDDMHFTVKGSGESTGLVDVMPRVDVAAIR